ncbi:Helix-turn-helix domain protein [compost metagenome]
MYLSTSKESLLVYEALASEVRLKIIELLDERPRSIKELAAELYLSSAIVSSHVSKLQEAGLVSGKMCRVDGATYKICSLSANYLQIRLSRAQQTAQKVVEFSVPIGQYTDFEAHPTCGIATKEQIIGYYDDPRYFADPRRMDAGIIWFAKGYVEYRLPNYLASDQTVQEIEISMEIGSEAPKISEKWPSDIGFTLNGVDLGTWTSPGDFGATKGRFTPGWWHADVNQYGTLKVLRIRKTGTFMDGQQMSGISLDDVDWRKEQWSFRITAEPAGRRRGGLTVFGRGFGNYDQDLNIRVYYE